MSSLLVGYSFPAPWGYQAEPGSATHAKVTDALANTVAEHVPIIAALRMCNAVNAQIRTFRGDEQPSALPGFGGANAVPKP